MTAVRPDRPVPEPVAVIGHDDTAVALGSALQHAGHDVTWWWPEGQQDQPPQLPDGAVRAARAADAVLGRHVVVLRLPDAEAVRRLVLDGPDALADALGPRSVLVDTSPLAPREARSVARACERRLLRVLEVALSGTARQAADGTLATHVGGDPETMEEVRQVLEVWTAPGRLTWAGDAGSGAAARAVVAATRAVALQGVGEMLRLGRDLGLPRAVVLEVLRTGVLGGVVSGRDRRLHEQDAGGAATPVTETLADALGELEVAVRYAGSALPALEGAYLGARLAVSDGRGGDDLVALALAREGRAHLDDVDLQPAPPEPAP